MRQIGAVSVARIIKTTVGSVRVPKMNVHGRFRRTPSFVAFVQFSGQGVSTNITATVPDIPDLWTNERTNARASGAKKIEQRENRRRAYFGGFFFGDTCNYSSRTRADINGELLDGHTDIPARRSFRGPFNFHDSWRPCWDGRITRVDTGYCTYAQDVAGASALADTTHAGARMNFDKTARISTEDRDSTSARRRVWRGQFNEIQPGLRIPDPMWGRRFFPFFFLLHTSCHRDRRRMKSIHSTSHGDRLLVGNPAECEGVRDDIHYSR